MGMASLSVRAVGREPSDCGWAGTESEGGAAVSSASGRGCEGWSAGLPPRPLFLPRRWAFLLPPGGFVEGEEGAG